jgi:endonuclease YncB( thermonuclease family)
MQRLTIRVIFALLICVVGYSASGQAQEKEKASPSLPPTTTASPSKSDGQQSQDARASWTYSTYQGKVSDVLDGNTIILLVENKKFPVRLLGVGAPEKGETFAGKSRDNLSRLLNSKNVEVMVIPQKSNQDGQSLVTGKVMLQGTDVGLEQIRGGFGWHSDDLEDYQTHEDRLAYAEARKVAAEKKLGLWSDSYRCKGDSLPLTTNPAPLTGASESKASVTESIQVQVLIDESGKVISAKALCGNPLLQQAGVKAAYGAKFTRTFLSGSPVKVTGVITYKFVVQ